MNRQARKAKYMFRKKNFGSAGGVIYRLEVMNSDPARNDLQISKSEARELKPLLFPFDTFWLELDPVNSFVGDKSIFEVFSSR